MVLESGGTLRRELRDGVPVYWAPEAPRLTGVLMFRVGRADETAVTGGITHLVEHLVLYSLGANQPYPFNGQVDGTRALFHATGSPGEVASFLGRICEAIAALPLDRIGAESRVLRTEAAGRTPGPVEALQWHRFGSRGHGLLMVREYALDAPNREAVRAWAAERFTAENACAWFSGPVPEGVSFAALPRGRRIPSPEPEPVSRLRTPAYLLGRSGGVALSFVTDRDAWIGIPWRIAAMRLSERLRYRQGVTYGIQLEGHPLSASRSHSTILATCLDEHAPAVEQGLLDVLDSLGRDGPTVEELRQVREGQAREMADPASVLGDLDSASLNDLLGYPFKSRKTLLEEMEGIGVERWAASVRSALDSALLMLPPGCPAPPGPFSPYPAASSAAAGGRRFRSVARRFPWSKKGPELIAGKAGVSLVLPESGPRTVLYDACAGVVVHPDGVIHLMGNDAVSLWIKPAEWRHGQRACDDILRAAPIGQLLVIPSR